MKLRRSICVYVLGIVVCGVLLLWFLTEGVDQAGDAPIQTTAEEEVSEQTLSAAHQEDFNVGNNTEEVPTLDHTPKPTARQKVADELLNTPIGHLTRNQASELIQRLIDAPESGSLFEEWLTSDNLEKRLIAIYSVLEKEGPTERILSMALSNTSPLVQAELVNWLFREHHFAEMNMFI
jgi:hypothetical protein